MQKTNQFGQNNSMKYSSVLPQEHLPELSCARKRSKTLNLKKFSIKIAQENLDFLIHQNNEDKLRNKRYIQEAYTTRNQQLIPLNKPLSQSPQKRTRVQTKISQNSPKISTCRPQNYYEIEKNNQRRQERFSYDNHIIVTNIQEIQYNSLFQTFCKEFNLQIDKIRRQRDWIQKQLTMRYNLKVAQFIVTFLELPKYLDFIYWKNCVQKLIKLHKEGQIVVMFKLFDQNADNYVSSTDIFKLQLSISNHSEPINLDVIQILNYAQNQLNQQSVDDEELFFLSKSFIQRVNLTLNEMITWTETYQNDQSQDSRTKKGLNYQRQFPFQSFIGSKHYFGEEDTDNQQQDFLLKYPPQYEQREAFSLSFPLFRRVFLNSQCNLWNDFINYFSGISQ